MNQHTPYQHTLANSISCRGVALHSGKTVSMTLLPAPENTGIVFRRTDMAEHQYIPALFDRVTFTTLNTTITNEAGISVSTIEHLMAGFWGCGVDNAIVEIDGAEVPIMDGSAAPFVFLIECAGTSKQDAPRKIIEILKPVHVIDGDKTASLLPGDDFAIRLDIDFGNTFIAQQSLDYHSGENSFKTDLSRARTFGFAHEVERLQAMGLAQGGSLNNAIVVSGDKILNEDGLRYPDEFVRHKILDCIGDLYLAGAFIKGHFTGARIGHALNNRILHALFSDPTAWRYVDAPVGAEEVAAMVAMQAEANALALTH